MPVRHSTEPEEVWIEVRLGPTFRRVSIPVRLADATVLGKHDGRGCEHDQGVLKAVAEDESAVVVVGQVADEEILEALAFEHVVLLREDLPR